MAFLLLFSCATLVLPIVTNGLRILSLWYAPMADTGQTSFLYPFLEYVLAISAVLLVTGLLLRRVNWERFIPLAGQTGRMSIIRGVWNDSFGKVIVLTYPPLYFASFLIASNLLMVPNLNISSYFIPVTLDGFQGNGIPMLGPLALNFDFMVLGIGNAVILSLALIFGYYISCLTYVSKKAFDIGVPGSMGIAATQGAGGFLAASTPALATTSAICCLTPTGMNSLLYLVSASSSILSKKLIWTYGTIAGAFWVIGTLQGIELLSTMALGLALLGLSLYQVRRIQNNLSQRRILRLH